jgi:hypothetical protein
VPEGILRQSLLEGYIKFLATSPVRHESPPEWAMWVKRLLGAAEVTDRRVWLDQIERVADPVIAVYARLARLRLK